MPRRVNSSPMKHEGLLVGIRYLPRDFHFHSSLVRSRSIPLAPAACDFFFRTRTDFVVWRAREEYHPSKPFEGPRALRARVHIVGCCIGEGYATERAIGQPFKGNLGLHNRNERNPCIHLVPHPISSTRATLLGGELGSQSRHTATLPNLHIIQGY
jgi:hypothetical protein